MDNKLPTAIIIAGHAGTGKTKFSKKLLALAADKGKHLAFLDKDTIGGKFSQLIMQMKTGDPYDRDSDEFKSLVRPIEYAALTNVALDNLKNGISCILCAPFGSECKSQDSFEKYVADTFKDIAQVVLVWAYVHPTEAKRRILKRAHPMDRYKLEHWDEYIKRRYMANWVLSAPTYAMWLESDQNNDLVAQWAVDKLA